jgi:hypothetical protein
MFGMRCTSPEWPRLAAPAPRHNAPLGRGALLSTYASGKLTTRRLSTPYRLLETSRPSDYACFTAFAGNSLIGEALAIGVVGLRADLSGVLHYSITQNSI